MLFKQMQPFTQPFSFVLEMNKAIFLLLSTLWYNFVQVVNWVHSVSEKRRYLYNKVDKILILITAVIVVLTVLIGFARYVESDTESTQSTESEVIQKIKIEAGSKIPEALTFLKDHSLYCFYLTDTTSIDTSPYLSGKPYPLIFPSRNASRRSWECKIIKPDTAQKI